MTVPLKQCASPTNKYIACICIRQDRGARHLRELARRTLDGNSEREEGEPRGLDLFHLIKSTDNEAKRSIHRNPSSPLHPLNAFLDFSVCRLDVVSSCIATGKMSLNYPLPPAISRPFTALSTATWSISLRGNVTESLIVDDFAFINAC